jgi:hypothetical protein
MHTRRASAFLQIVELAAGAVRITRERDAFWPSGASSAWNLVPLEPCPLPLSAPDHGPLCPRARAIEKDSHTQRFAALCGH